jgi:hypothetical protein
MCVKLSSAPNRARERVEFECAAVRTAGSTVSLHPEPVCIILKASAIGVQVRRSFVGYAAPGQTLRPVIFSERVLYLRTARRMAASLREKIGVRFRAAKVTGIH